MMPPHPASRWLAAAGFALAPLLLWVLPSLLARAEYANPEEQFRAFASGPPRYGLFLLQAAGAACLVPASLGVLALLRVRRRGVRLGYLGAVLSLATAILGLLLIGAELTQVFVVTYGDDTDAMVDLALAINQWTLFTVLLFGTILGFLLSPPLLALGLWRAKIVPFAAVALFLLPAAAGILPVDGLPGRLLLAVCLLAPSGWVAERILRAPAGQPAEPEPRRGSPVEPAPG